MGKISELFRKNIGLAFFLLILAVSVFIFIAVILQTQNILVQADENEGLSSVKIAAGMIDGNMLESIGPGDENTTAYKSLQTDLNQLRSANPNIRHIYTMKRINGTIVFAVDADYGSRTSSVQGARIGETYTNVTPALMKGFYAPVTGAGFTTDEWGTVLSSFAPVYNQRGEVVGVVGVDLDAGILSSRMTMLKNMYILVLLAIFVVAVSVAAFTASMQKEAYRALRENEEYLNTIMQSIQAGVLIIDAETHIITDANPKALSLIGAKKEDVAGKTCHAFVCPAETGNCPVTDLEETVDNEERILLDINGRKIPIIKSVNRITLGKKKMLIESFVDISERKKMEEQNAQLIKDLETANSELKDFAYIVSHDLKAPLRAIGSLSQWLYSDYKDKFDDDGKTQLDLLVNRVQRMQNLIEGILEYSRVGRVREEKEPVRLDAVIPDIIDSLSLPPHIAVTIDPQLPVIAYEKTRIRQVFANLIGNAAKYMDKPAGEIHVGCKPDGSFWKFSVADNGPGIDSRHYEKIFQIFQTLQPRDHIESTGIGLSIVKKIVEMNGGKIWVESEVGKGSIFYFTVPISGISDEGSP
ncbi:ATP-binding protein [Methanoregula sp.]|uniref:PAS domain-containing sensor histidine kinase n=1 Tax=Methanoregula sp. TaxID=2052170 RepID=UPI0035678E5C